MNSQNKTLIVYSVGLIALLSVITPLVFQIASVSAVYTGFQLMPLGVMILYSLIAGYGLSKALQRFNDSKAVAVSAISSTIFAVILGLQKVINDSLVRLSHSTSTIDGSTSIITNTEPVVTPAMTFVLTMVAFNLVVFYNYLQNENKSIKPLAFYIIPIIVYLAIPMIL